MEKSAIYGNHHAMHFISCGVGGPIRGSYYTKPIATMDGLRRTTENVQTERRQRFPQSPSLPLKALYERC